MRIKKLGSFLESNKSYCFSKEISEKYKNNTAFPWLVSFPRTGSHWLRMLMELYFEKPALVRSFYYHNASSFTCYHDHDEELELVGIRKVIYLYRDPVPTIYSQMRYYQENLDDEVRVVHWTKKYYFHLKKWLIEEGFTESKIIIRYEYLKSNLDEEFGKLTGFFNCKWNKEKLLKASLQVNKKEVKEKTSHDKQVINLTKEYERQRDEFREKFGRTIHQLMLNDKKLTPYFQ